MKITVETVVEAKLDKLWDAWNNPADIKQWNTARMTGTRPVALSICAKAESSCRAWKPKTAARASTSRARTPASWPTRPSNTG
jgi:hypothetical protein